MDEDVRNPFGYATPPGSPDHQFQVCPGAAAGPAGQANSCTPPPDSPPNAEGTPKVPLVPFGGPPGRSCPAAPRKGRPPSNFYDHVSGDAPIRRLSFAAAADSACVSPEPSGDHATDSMDEDMGLDQEALQHEHTQWQQQQVQQQSPAAASQFSSLHIPQQVQNQEQLLLSPSPPPVQQLFSQQGQHQVQQLFTAPGQAPQQVHRPNSVQQQLFAAPTPTSGCQLRPQQLWPGQQPQQPANQQQQQLMQQQGVWGNPMSPAGRPRPPAMQGSTTPARLFR